MIGVRNKKVQDQLLRESKLTFNKACEIARAEQCREQFAAINQNEAVKVVQRQRRRDNGGHQNRSSKCGRQHNYAECPAYGKQCRVCQGMNHFAVTCKKKPQDGMANTYKNIKYKKTNDFNSKIESF